LLSVDLVCVDLSKAHENDGIRGRCYGQFVEGEIAGKAYGIG